MTIHAYHKKTIHIEGRPVFLNEMSENTANNPNTYKRLDIDDKGTITYCATDWLIGTNISELEKTHILEYQTV
jgi:hypothetical protein